MTIAFDPLDRSFLVDPYPTYQQLRNGNPVMFLPALDVWCVTGYVDVAAVLRRPEVFSSALGLGSGWVLRDDRRIPPIEMDFQASVAQVPAMLCADPPDHERVRRPVAAVFSGSRFRKIESNIQQCVEELLDDLIEHGRARSVDLVSEVAKPLSSSTILRTVGLPLSNRTQFVHYAEQIVSSWDPTDSRSTDTARPQALKGTWALHREVIRAVASHEADEGETVVSVLRTTSRDATHSMSRYEVFACVSLLLMAGFETTSCAIANALDLLLQRPDLHYALQGDRTLVGPFVEESIRLESPVQTTWRGLLTDSRVGEVSLPKGARLMVSLGSANRDERRFNAPDTFEFDRRESHLGFGSGIHYCIGALLARKQMMHLLNGVLDRKILFTRAAGSERTTNLNVRGFKRIPVRVETMT